MTKNGRLVSDYLDYVGETRRLSASGKMDDLRLADERLKAGVGDDLYEACLNAGWTPAELDAAYRRRFHPKDA